MKILVTGGAGFQGTHLVNFWLQHGHDVAVLNTPSYRAVRDVERCLDPTVRTWWGSVTEPEVVRKAVQGQDVVVHLAAWASVDQSLRDPGASYAVNAHGTRTVLDAVRAEECRLIYASSCEIYGAQQGEALQTEDSPLHPASPYAAGKAAADVLVGAYWRSFGVRATTLRPCNVYGPGQRAGAFGAVIPAFVQAALLQDGIVTVRGAGDQEREYLHVTDLVHAYDLVLQRDDLDGQVFNIGSGETVSIKALAEWLITNVGGRIHHVEARAGEVSRFRLDSTRALHQLGFAPLIKFWLGLESYVEWVRGV